MDTRLNELIAAYQDGTASETQRGELAALISADLEAMQAFVESIRVHSLLREIKSESSRTPAITPHGTDHHEPLFVKYLKPIAACFIIALTVALFAAIMFRDPPPPVERGGIINAANIETSVTRNGKTIALAKDTLLQACDIIDVRPGLEDQRVSLTLTDGSRVELKPDTRLKFKEDNDFNLERGSVHCTIIPQNNVFRIHVEPTGTTVRVIGTEFEVTCIPMKGEAMNKQLISAVLITVLAGTVGVTPAGGEEMAVEAGKAVTVPAEGVAADPKADPGLPAVETPEKPADEITDEVRSILDRRVAFDLNGTSLSQATQFLGVYTRSKLVFKINTTGMAPEMVSPEGEVETPVTLRVHNMSLENALFWMAYVTGLTYGQKEHNIIFAPARFLPRHLKMHMPNEEEDKWFKDIEKALDKKVTFDFNETPIQDVANFMGKVTRLNILIDPAAVNPEAGPKNITLKVEDMTFRNALKWILRLTDLDFTIAREAVLISTRQKLQPAWQKQAEDLQLRSDQEPVVKLVNLVLLQSIKDQAARIRMEMVDGAISLKYEVDGKWLAMQPPPARLFDAILHRFKRMAKLDAVENGWGQIELRVGGAPYTLKVTVKDKVLDIEFLDKPVTVPDDADVPDDIF